MTVWRGGTRNQVIAVIMGLGILTGSVAESSEIFGKGKLNQETTSRETVASGNRVIGGSGVKICMQNCMTQTRIIGRDFHSAAPSKRGIIPAQTSLFLAKKQTQLAQAGDMVRGKKIFNKCKACHTLQAGKKKIGPHLQNIMGRAAGTVKGFKYSKSMAGSGLTWDKKTLRAYLKAPRKFLKGNRMAFAGLKKDKDIDDLFAYLEENTR